MSQQKRGVKEKNPPQKQEMEWDEVRNPPSKNLRRCWKLLLGGGAAEGMELEEHQGSTVPPLLGTVSVPAPGPMSLPKPEGISLFTPWIGSPV